MADVHTKEQRSYNMSRIKGKNTKPEMQVSRFLHAHGYRYRLDDKKLPGRPYEGILIRHCYFLFFLKAWILLFISGGETDPRMSGDARQERGHSISIYFCFIAVDYLL